MKDKIVLLMISLIFMVACGTGNNDWPIGEVLNEFTYTNEDLGFAIVLSDQWEISEREDTDISSLTTTPLTDEFFNALEENHFREFEAVNSETGATVTIMFERLSDDRRNITVEQYLEEVAPYLQSLGIDVYLGGVARLGTGNWHAYTTTLNMFGQNIYGSNLVRINNNFVKIVTVLSLESIDYNTNLIASMFHEF
ncbi:MAG: hypothetical protein FWE02_00425 [Defluviitaleaceae bacterium]|nr:hypothetical protein [Defluviitaleaceae bacterium]